MKYYEYKEKVIEMLRKNNKLWKQTHIMFIPINYKRMKEVAIGEEVRVRYDIDNVWDEFVYKENKVLFFVRKYFEYMLSGLDPMETMMKNSISFPINEIIEQALYYFDSFITAFSTILEGEQRELLCRYLNKNKINNFFPTRNEIGLFWEIYMLRNRIIHFTKGRYSDNKTECNRFEDFSSKVRMVIIDELENIHLTSTLIDINKSSYIQQIIKKCINDKDIKPFDVLFPNISAKGHGKNKPFLSVITNDIWFDHINSAIFLIERIQEILDKINHLFFEELLFNCNDIENIFRTKTCIYIENDKFEYSVQDVFDSELKK